MIFSHTDSLSSVMENKHGDLSLKTIERFLKNIHATMPMAQVCHLYILLKQAGFPSVLSVDAKGRHTLTFSNSHVATEAIEQIYHHILEGFGKTYRHPEWFSVLDAGMHHKTMQTEVRIVFVPNATFLA